MKPLTVEIGQKLRVLSSAPGTNEPFAASYLSPSAGKTTQPHTAPTASQQRHPVGKEANIDIFNTDI